MFAVVVCISGIRGVLTKKFLEGKDRQAVLALGPRHVLAALRDLEEKRISPPVVLTDTVECIQLVHLSPEHGLTPIVFWGDDPEGRASRATVCLPESADLTEVARTLDCLAKGVLPRPDNPGSLSRLRRI